MRVLSTLLLVLFVCIGCDPKVNSRAGPAGAVADSARDVAPTPAPTADAKTDSLKPATIHAYLASHPIEASILPAPFTSPRTTTPPLDAEASREGVVGTVTTSVEGANHAEISFIVFRDQSAAEASFATHALPGSRTFASVRGELVTSYSYAFKEHGSSKCLSRVHTGLTESSATCYLLVQFPSKAPVMITGRINEVHVGPATEVSRATIEHADDLLLAGLMFWENHHARMVAETRSKVAH